MQTYFTLGLIQTHAHSHADTHTTHTVSGNTSVSDGFEKSGQFFFGGGVGGG